MKKLILFNTLDKGNYLRFFCLGFDGYLLDEEKEEDTRREVIKILGLKTGIGFCDYYVKTEDLSELLMKCSVSGIEVLNAIKRIRLGPKEKQLIRDNLSTISKEEARAIKCKEVEKIIDEYNSFRKQFTLI